MNSRPSIIIVLFLLCSGLLSPCQDMDKELCSLAGKLAAQIKEQNKTNVAVVDFTDLQGGQIGDLGKYVAEQLTVELVLSNRNFSVLERGEIKRILAEHKLAATGLIDTESAKKLGMFLGVDALIWGIAIPKGTNSVSLIAKIGLVETARVVGGGRAEFKADDFVQQLISKPPVQNKGGDKKGADNKASDLPEEKAEVTKVFGDLRVELNSLTVPNQREYVLDLVLTNQNPKKSIWVAIGINPNGTGTSKAMVRSPEHIEFETWAHLVSGIETASLSYKGTFDKATEIKPGDSISASLKFSGSGVGGPALAGPCTVRLEFLLGNTLHRGFDAKATPHNLMAKMEAK